MPFGYTRSNNGGTTWTSLAVVDTIRTVSPIIVSSHVSDKVAIVYTHPTDTTQERNDIYYVQSSDGLNWNGFQPKINVTNYHFGGDSLYAWTEVSALYDFNDNLHVVWPAQYVAGPPNSSPSFYIARAHLYHWDASSNTISSFASFDSTWPTTGCEIPSGMFVFGMVSVAVDSSNRLYVAYTSWDSSDCSLAGYANGDIYLQRSFDSGATWTSKENLTNSHSPNCRAGDCFSDIYPSLAERADNLVHLFYLCIHIGQNPYLDCPMLYLPIPAGTQGAGESNSLPSGFSLDQNYPNPFNAQTSISYILGQKSQINLSIYNLVGQKVATLVSGIQNAGEYKIIWDAKKMPSGIYYARLEVGEGSQSIKMMLIK